jgi:hypothetical protein
VQGFDVHHLLLIEWRYGLDLLSERDAEANNLLAAFDFEPPSTADDVEQGSNTPGGPDRTLLAAVLLGVAAGAAILLWRRASHG